MKVFWSWQSDTPGKTGRHFVKRVLENAVKSLNQHDDIIESLRPEVEIDHDRKGVPGSPDLASIILQKIDQAAVLVADVTPVASLKRTLNGSEEETKKLMNPNVAIELGYALKSLTDASILLVFNSHYGDRKDLPFDLAHKAGPIFFSLPPNANKSEIAKEEKALTIKLKEAIGACLASDPKKPITPEYDFGEMTSINENDLYFEPGSKLAIGGDPAEHDAVEMKFLGAPYFLLRLIPSEANKKFRKVEIKNLIDEYRLGPYDRNSAGWSHINQYGAITIKTGNNSPKITSLTQVLQNGEVWGISKAFHSSHENLKKYVPNIFLEEQLSKSIHQYVAFAEDALELSPPIAIDFGANGLSNYGLTQGQRPWIDVVPFHDDTFMERVILNEFSNEQMEAAIDSFLDSLYDLAGLSRS
jgi:hypothetical protein